MTPTDRKFFMDVNCARHGQQAAPGWSARRGEKERTDLAVEALDLKPGDGGGHRLRHGLYATAWPESW